MKFLLIVFCALSFGACASHSTVSSETHATSESGATERLGTFTFHLDGPPKLGSPEDENDYETLSRLQRSRKDEDCVRARTEVRMSLGTFYGKPYGPLTEVEVAELTHLFEILSKEAWPLINHEKKAFQRPRPYVIHDDLSPCVKTEPTSSYPSAHAAVSRFYMNILMTLFPDRKDALEKRAEQIAFDRNLVGVHYPTDVRDGKRLGEEIYQYLAKDNQFKKLIATQALHL